MNCSKVEVKSDGLTRRTGRIFIETTHKGAPSGINVTESAHWAIEIFFISVGAFAVWAIVHTLRETFGGK